MSTDGQGTKWRRNIGENVNRLSTAHERYRQTTDGRATAYSEFTFAKKLLNIFKSSTAIVLRCGGIVNSEFITKLLLMVIKMKVGQKLAKLWTVYHLTTSF